MPNLLNEIIHLLAVNKYFLLFVGVFVEGPTSTTTGAFAASLGYMNIYIVFVITFFGNFLADIMYYFIGYFSREIIIEKYKKKWKLDQNKLNLIEKISSESGWKAVMTSKFIPFFAIPTLTITGAIRTSFKKFVQWIIIATVLNSLLFTLVGYFFGKSYLYFHDILAPFIDEISLIFLLIFIVILFIFKKVLSFFLSKIQEDKL